ncbi:MAG: hypothetical protein EOP04_07705 [Proteobacteria bacterium]|nr:MAG: hypothetical protein EOP04_07705 [Pseudomonadota bacterium]
MSTPKEIERLFKMRQEFKECGQCCNSYAVPLSASEISSKKSEHERAQKITALIQKSNFSSKMVRKGSGCESVLLVSIPLQIAGLDIKP